MMTHDYFEIEGRDGGGRSSGRWLNTQMKSRLTINIVAVLALALALPAVLHAQTIGIMRDGSSIHVDVETIPTQQFWVTESVDLTCWTNRTFVDHSTTIDLGPPKSGSHFFALDPLYRQIAWTATNTMPLARDQFTGGVIDGKLYVFGGNGNPDGVNLSRLDIYDVKTGLWTRGADYNYGIEELSSAVVGGKLYVFGGYDGSGPHFTNLSYDPAVDLWSEIAEKPAPIQNTTAVAWGDEILTVGSFLGEPEDELTTVVEAYHTLSNSWRFVTNLPDESERVAAAICEDILYVIGGVHLQTLTAYNKVRRFDLKNGVWLPEINGALPHPIIAAYTVACPVVNGNLIIGGGLITINGSFAITNPETQVATSDLVTVYDTRSNSFSQNTAMPEAVDGHLFLLIEDKIIALGGRDSLSGETATRSDRMHIGVFDK